MTSAGISDEQKTDIDFQWGVKIPMRDGVHLNATLYRPKGLQPVPVIITITPYTADTYHSRGMYFAQSGYAFALIDCRGRGNSEGEWLAAGKHDALDAYDAIEWLAAQVWCDGQVAMWGGSYAGWNQWAAARTGAPQLRTIVPAAAAYEGIDVPCFNGIFLAYWIQWATLTSGVTANANLFGEAQFWIDKFRELYLNHRPFAELAQIVGNDSRYFKDVIDHPHRSLFYDEANPSPAELASMELPVLTITGHYDGDQLGALEHYRQHMRHASATAREKHYLIMGPWDHAGTRTPQKEVGGLTFGDASMLDLNKLHKEWYDWIMRDRPRPEFLKKRVAYYVTGLEEWKYADELESIAQYQPLYLTSTNGCANDVFASGMLLTAPVDTEADSYIYNPLDTRPELLDRNEVKQQLTDQRYAINLFGSGLVYHSELFDSPIEITGQPRVTAWIEIDVPDTDFICDLYEIKLDGSSVLLSGTWLRARYRESLYEERLVTPGEINCYVLQPFSYISRRIAQGSRLRLVIKANNSIYLQKNYNSGGIVAEETAAEAQIAHVKLYHDTEHPSMLEIPVAVI